MWDTEKGKLNKEEIEMMLGGIFFINNVLNY